MGNPNTGKTSLFNALTGLNQQVGNYPGITVEKKIGHCKLPDNQQAEIIDLPGTYSLNPSSEDEQVAVDTLINRQGTYFPDVVVVVSEVSNLKQNLLLFTQVKDLQLPTILVINMADQMQRKGISIDIPQLERLLHTRVILTSTRKGEGLLALKQAIVNFKELSVAPCVDMSRLEAIPFGTSESEQRRKQQKETIIRYQFINETLKETYTVDQHKAQTLTRPPRPFSHTSILWLCGICRHTIAHFPSCFHLVKLPNGLDRERVWYFRRMAGDQIACRRTY